MRSNPPASGSSQLHTITTDSVVALTTLVETLAQPGFAAALVGWFRRLTALEQVSATGD